MKILKYFLVLLNFYIFTIIYIFKNNEIVKYEISFCIGREIYFYMNNTSTLATSCEELTHWKILWCWEGLGAGGKGDDRGWDGWMASPTRFTCTWGSSGSWWWTGRPGVLQFMGSKRVGHSWANELNWTE